jgi:hypothetical protein
MPTISTSMPEAFGPIPEANQPGHHPDVEQDKPRRPPRKRSALVLHHRRFAFRFDPRYLLLGAPFGVLPQTTHIDVGEEVEIRFGPWSMRFPRAEVRSVDETGPYHLWKTAGPPHLSLADGGVTFATNGERGVCIQLARPRGAIAPFGIIRHPAVTVTPESPDALVEALLA